MYVTLTFAQQLTLNDMSQRHIQDVFGFQGPLSGITYNLTQDQLLKSLYNLKQLYQENSQSIKQSQLIVITHFVYIIMFSIVGLIYVHSVTEKRPPGQRFFEITVLYCLAS